MVKTKYYLIRNKLHGLQKSKNVKSIMMEIKKI